jgi:dUTPase
MLTGHEIRRLGLIENDFDKSYRAASYDIRVGTVIKPDGSLSSLYLLPPQGIAEVISVETVSIPDNVSGIAMVKTSLCNEEILPLNIGIIDPGYQGKLSSVIVNFGKNSRAIKVNEVFLRLIFYNLDGEIDVKTPSIFDDDKYLLDRRSNMIERFGSEFLNLGTITATYTRKLYEEYRTRILSYVAAAGIGLTILTFMLNYANIQLVNRFYSPNDAAKLDVLQKDLSTQNDIFVSRMKELSDQLTGIASESKREAELIQNLIGRVNKMERDVGAPSAPK